MEPEAEPGPFVVKYIDIKCQNSTIVGGKGASLALMDSLCDPKVKVPPGFCLTVTALESQLAVHPQLQEAIIQIERISSGQAKGDLKQECERTVALFEATPVCDSIKLEVMNALQWLDTSRPCAVRSSAVGEDSEDLSAAGQNATFLGLREGPQIMDAVQKCWGSLFAFQSVEYRRQHGQPIQCGMGIVVQSMVPADVAGVLFTKHPVTGAPDQMLITANYGLGESVVSAQVEPDSIVLLRNWQDRLTLLQATCGSKAHKVEMTGEGGVTTVVLGEDEVSQVCISAAEQLELGQIGVQLEAMFGSPRDIEWAIAQDQIYILQARPITSLDTWSEFELLHEFDTPLVIDREVLTTANTGEVFPGATAPLTLSTIIPLVERAVKTSTKSGNKPYQMSCISVSHHHVFLNMLNTVLLRAGEKIEMVNKLVDLAVFGHLVTTPELLQLGIERNGLMSSLKKTLDLLGMIKDSIYNNYMTNKGQKISKHVGLNSSHFTTANVHYKAITHNMEHLIKVAECHSHTSRISSFSQTITFTILTEGQNDLTPEHYEDIALLLSSNSDVISADVPAALKELANCVLWSGRQEEFCSLPPSLAVEWLELNTSGDIAVKYKEFLSKHGHRCIREFDVMSESWSMKPDSIVQTVQTLVKHADNSKKEAKSVSVEEIVAGLKSVTKPNTRKIIRWLLPWCRRSVSNRETSKASVISVIHQFRIAYRRLALLLQHEGRLPDPQLIFFMTHYEIGQLLKTRDPVLLKKAVQRRRLWLQWDQLTFPEISIGLPSPISAEVTALGADSKTYLKGTAVCSGTVIARACVVLQIEDISQLLQKGDILITHSTDIGWSPYFPLLGGVVTELGGLISHGAVVAREYGLPCIVGAQNATSIFKTGDTVLLIGSTGMLQKVEDVEIEES